MLEQDNLTTVSISLQPRRSSQQAESSNLPGLVVVIWKSTYGTWTLCRGWIFPQRRLTEQSSRSRWLHYSHYSNPSPWTLTPRSCRTTLFPVEPLALLPIPANTRAAGPPMHPTAGYLDTCGLYRCRSNSNCGYGRLSCSHCRLPWPPFFVSVNVYRGSLFDVVAEKKTNPKHSRQQLGISRKVSNVFGSVHVGLRLFSLEFYDTSYHPTAEREPGNVVQNA